jgi:hypothetical protein
MSLQFTIITSFIGTVEGRHSQSKAEDERLGSVRPQGNFSPARFVVKNNLILFVLIDVNK